MKPQPKKNNHRLRWVLITAGIVVVLIAAVVGIVANRIVQDFSNSKAGKVVDELPPCGTNATQIGLGSPYRHNKVVAYFTTEGSDVYISARKFPHGSFLDPKTGVTNIWIGDAATLPTYDEQRSVVSNTKLNFSVEEGKHKKAALPAGRYWLWTSTGGDIAVASCGQISGQLPDGTAAPVAHISGVEGTVTYGPLCPVEPCSQKPSYDFDVIALRDGREVGKTRPDQNGYYQLLLSPGTYELRSSRSFAPGTPYTVTVEDGKMTRSDLSFDTGIR